MLASHASHDASQLVSAAAAAAAAAAAVERHTYQRTPLHQWITQQKTEHENSSFAKVAAAVQTKKTCTGMHAAILEVEAARRRAFHTANTASSATECCEAGTV